MNCELRLLKTLRTWFEYAGIQDSLHPEAKIRVFDWDKFRFLRVQFGSVRQGTYLNWVLMELKMLEGQELTPRLF